MQNSKLGGFMTGLYSVSKENKKLSAHFHSDEFACKCCGYALIDSELVTLLENIRSIVMFPIVLRSAYRCPKHNTAEGGALMSAHLGGWAADITWQGAEHDIKTAEFKVKLRSLAVKLNLCGIGWGSDWIHVDVDMTRHGLTEWKY